MAISKIFVPLFGGDEDAATLELAAETALYFHAHLEAAAGGARPGKDLHAVFEEWRNRHGLELQPECRHRGLASASWIDLGSASGEGLAHRAKFADLVCLAVEAGGGGRAAGALEAVLFASGRPALLRPMRDYAAAPLLGQPVVIGWNGSVEAVRALAGALPFLAASRRVEVLSIGEESVNAFDAYELAKYLGWCGIRAAASGIAKEDWTGGDVVDAALAKGAKLLVMGARPGGGATSHMLDALPIAALMAA